MEIVTNTLTGILLSLYTLTNNLGLTIIIFAFLVRTIMLPLTLPAIKTQRQIKKIQPEINKLKAKHKGDQKAYNQAQLELYKQYNINPISGCVPQIIQIVLIIILYQIFTHFLSQETINGITLNPSFLWLDLRHPDPRWIIPILAGVSQLILSLMIAPGGEVKDIVPNTSKKKKVQDANKKEEDTADMASMMQQQMIFMLPAITTFAAFRFPAGLGLYWVATTLVSIVQQYFISGPGGLTLYARRAVVWVKSKLTRA